MPDLDGVEELSHQSDVRHQAERLDRNMREVLDKKFPRQSSVGGYFNGQSLEEMKPLQMIGVPMTPENVDRENQVGSIVEKNLNKLRYCYERALAKESLPKVAAIFYFTVGAEGSFKDITADFIGDRQSNISDLLSCSSASIGTFRASSWNAERTFRFRTKFSSSQ